MNKKLIFKITVIMLMCFSVTACRKETDVSLSESTSMASLEQNESGQSDGVGNDKSYKVVVYVNGAVKRPGVYTLNEGDRIYQAIDMAGGMTSKAQKDAINLAETVTDAENIYVMTKREYKKSQAEDLDGAEKQEKNSSTADGRGNDANVELVNINTAGKEQLTTLPGVGDSKAAAIITYREENGSFSSKEDIKKVTGIGDATYANIEDMITIE